MKNELRKMMLQLFAEGDDPDPKNDPGNEPDPNKDDNSDDKGGDNNEPDGKKDELEKKYTDDDVNKIVQKKIAEERKKAEEQAKKEAKKAKMSAEEKAKFEREELEKERDDLKKQILHHELSDKAAQMLKEQGISATPEMLAFVVGEDEEATEENVKKFVGVINDQQKLADEKRAKGKTPEDFGDNNGDPKMTEVEKRIAKYTGGTKK